MFGANIKELLKEGRQAWERLQELEAERREELRKLPRNENYLKDLDRRISFFSSIYYDCKDQLNKLGEYMI